MKRFGEKRYGCHRGSYSRRLETCEEVVDISAIAYTWRNGWQQYPSGIAVVVVRILDAHDRANTRRGEEIRWSRSKWEVDEYWGS